MDVIEELRSQVRGERRTLTCRVEWEPESRDSDGAGLRLRGRAVVYGVPTTIGHGRNRFVEEIQQGAFARSLREQGDRVALLWQHDAAQPLARVANGTLELADRPDGLHFRADVVPTSYGRDAVTAVRAGLVDECSFLFIGRNDRWSKRDGMPYRLVLDADIFECSLVTFPAYKDGTYAEPEREAELVGELRASGRLPRRPSSPYRPDGPHSWFRDLAVAAHARATTDLAVTRGQRVGTLLEASFLGSRTEAGEQGGLKEAQERLARHHEARDVTSADPGAGAFVPAGPPAYVAEEFARAARSQATLAAALRTAPLPPQGLTVEVPRITTGSTVAVQAAENDAASDNSANWDSELAASPVGYLAGKVTVSQQALDRSLPGLDLVIARDLGAALGAVVDAQVIAGTGTDGQTLGLATVTGIKTVTWTDGSPTSQEFIGKCWAAFNEIASAGYGTSDPAAFLTVMHARRYAWALHNAQNGQTIEPRFPGQTVLTGGVRVALGAGTNEDEAFVLVRDETVLYVEPPRVGVFVDLAGSGTLTVTVRALQPLALMAARAPDSICRISGTGCAAPSL
jgi:HK97 family phage prohead protease